MLFSEEIVITTPSYWRAKIGIGCLVRAREWGMGDIIGRGIDIDVDVGVDIDIDINRDVNTDMKSTMSEVVVNHRDISGCKETL